MENGQYLINSSEESILGVKGFSEGKVPKCNLIQNSITEKLWKNLKMRLCKR